MIISHKHKFIFIHIQKCAGTSITYALNKYLGEEDIVLGCTPQGEKLSAVWGKTKGLYKHVNSANAKAVLGEKIWNEYFKFSFIRNPWDLVVSTYHWWLETSWDDEQQTGQKVRALKNFEEYVFSLYLRTETCSEYIMDGKGNCLVDFIGRQESLERDFAYICGRLNLPNIELPQKNASQHRDFRSYYSQAMQETVAQKFKWDLKNFQYSFS